MKHYILYSALFLMAFSFGCDNSDDSFDNKVYVSSSSKTSELLVKAGVNDVEKNIQAAIAQPSIQDIIVNYRVDPALVATYNLAYYDNAVMLPAEYYSLPENTVTITAGNVLSKKLKVLFKDLSQLDREIVYVLPVSMDSEDIDVLASAKTLYYVIKGAALINVVADIGENYLTINWTNPDVCNNLSQLTMEALVRIHDFDRMISTLMGIEGHFLIRLGDAGFPSNQIQVATSGGNFPDGDTNKGLPTNEWVHIALSYDSSTGEMIVYVNGNKQSETTKFLGNVNLGQGGASGFCIGRSYADERYLAGEISECRIWNIVRSKEDIAANPYYVDPASEGLVAYWKFNDESALSVEDHTGNGNNAVAKSVLKWSPVILPAPGE